MTDPTVRLEQTTLTVEPGGQATTVVTVRNLGTIVEGFRLQPLGDQVAAWTQISPPELQVYPEQEATAVVVFAPPPGTRSGTFPFAVRAESVVDASTSALAEGDLEIGRVFGLQSKITPVTSSGRWRGKHFLEITNWGNAPVRLTLTAADPDERLAFLIGPDTLDLPLGVTGHAQLRVRTLKPFLRGTKERLPFQVVAQPGTPAVPTGPPGVPLNLMPNPQRTTMDGAFVQRPILSRWTVVAAAAVVLVIGGLVAFALTRTSAPGPGDLATGPPNTPTLTAAAGSDATTVALQWEGQPNIQSYRINQLTAEGRTTQVTPVDGQLDAYLVEQLQPQTTYCFEIQAVRGTQLSGLSERQCATTTVAPASASPGASPSPETSPSAPPTESGPASPTAGSTVVPSPTGGPSVGGSTAAQLPGGGPVPGGGGPGGGTGGPTGGSTLAGGTTGPGTGTGTGIPVFGPTQFISVPFSVPVSDADPLGRVQAARQTLVAAGIPAQILLTGDFPNMLLAGNRPATESYLIYVGPFNSQPEARAWCDAQPTLKASCLVVQPSPAG